MKECSNCGNGVSPKATSCPKCGHPLSGGVGRIVCFTLICLVLIYIGLTLIVGGNLFSFLF